MLKLKCIDTPCTKVSSESIKKVDLIELNENESNEIRLSDNASFGDFMKGSKEESMPSSNDILETFENNPLKDKNEEYDTDKINYDEIYLINKSQKISDQTNCSNSEGQFLSKKRKNPEKKYIRKKEHSKFEKDNIMRKLNIHYISFIVKFVNFNIKRIISKRHPLFTNLSYEFKKRINSSYFNELKKMTLGEVLKNEGSSKNKRNMVFPKDSNEKIFNLVYSSLKDLLDINYVEFFRQVYNRPLIDSEGIKNITKIYKAPKNIFYFDDFIKKEMEKDKVNGQNYMDRIKSISKKEFIHNGCPYFKVRTKKCIQKNV